MSPPELEVTPMLRRWVVSIGVPLLVVVAGALLALVSAGAWNYFPLKYLFGK